MAAIKGKDTKPELVVRRLLHAAGFRYRLHAKDLPGKPDLVFPSRKAVVFVNGCYWPAAGTSARTLSSKLRAEVLDRDGYTCQSCGLTPSDTDPSTGRNVRLHIGHIIDKNLGGKDELSNLRALCSTCNQGAKNITSVKPNSIWLLSQIRRAGQDEQRDVFEWLKNKFKG